jgi:hypothetical protein
MVDRLSYDEALMKIKDLESELEHCRAMYLRDADTGEYYTVDDMLTVRAELAQKNIDLKLALDLLAGERTEIERLKKLLQQHQTYQTKQGEK